MPPRRKAAASPAPSARSEDNELTDLHCPLCLDIPDIANGHPVVQCTNGHIFCGNCLATHQAMGTEASRKCPTCRVALTAGPIRNRIAETAIGNLPGPCAGCGEGMLRKDLGLHMATCGEIHVECPFPNCTVRVKRKDLDAHMASAMNEHLALAQSLASEVTAQQQVLASLDVKGKMKIFELNKRTQNVDVLLKRMEPIEANFRLRSLLGAEYRRDYRFDRDVSKTPHELNLRDGFVLTATSLNAPVNLKVVTQDGEEVFFKCRESTPLVKLMQAFCQRQGIAMNSVSFLFDGERINPTQTPHDLEMEDGDVVDVVLN